MTAQYSASTPSSQEPDRERIVTLIDFDDEEQIYVCDDFFYNRVHDCWEPRPEWMHPDCANTLLAQQQGTCCMYPADALVERALDLAEEVDRTLTGFDRDGGDCSQTAGELARLLESVPALAAEIHDRLPDAERTVVEQLLCPIDRLLLLGLELAGRPGCPWACSDHGAPDRRAEVALLIPVLERCDEALRAAVLPQPRRRRRR